MQRERYGLIQNSAVNIMHTQVIMHPACCNRAPIPSQLLSAHRACITDGACRCGPCKSLQDSQDLYSAANILGSQTCPNDFNGTCVIDVVSSCTAPQTFLFEPHTVIVLHSL